MLHKEHRLDMKEDEGSSVISFAQVQAILEKPVISSLDILEFDFTSRRSISANFGYTVDPRRIEAS